MLSKEEVIHIAGLANLKLSGQEVKKLQEELGRTLDYVQVLNELDTKKVKPTFQVTGLKNIFRKDKVEASLSQKEALSGTKSKNGKYFNSPNVFGWN